MIAKLTNKTKPNGFLPLDLGWRGGFQRFTITGGPYDAFEDFAAKHADAFGVCVRAERVPNDVDLHLPIRDFDVPEDSMKVRSAVHIAAQAALDGKQVYVGCMGGWGRTGLFLALLAKACGVENPITYVRNNYTPHAVETPQQMHYVANFDVTELRAHIAWAGWTKWWRDRLFWWK